MGHAITNYQPGVNADFFDDRDAFSQRRRVRSFYDSPVSNESENIFNYAYEIMLDIQNLQESRAYSQFNNIQNASRRARDTQDMANRMDEVIAEAAKGDNNTRKKVPDAVIDYMRDHNIYVDDMPITDYIKKQGDAEGALDKGGLQAVKAALDNSSGRDGDMSAQAQLVIQKAIQMLNASITQSAGLVSKWGDILQLISQKTFS